MKTSKPTTAEPPSPSSDEEFRAELRAVCLQEGPATMRGIQQAFQAFAKNLKDAAALDSVYRKVHTAAGSAGLAGLPTIHRIASAIESLLRELKEKSDRVNPSVLRTIAQSIDFLNTLFQHAVPAERDHIPSLTVLALDDEEVALASVNHSLQKEDIQPVCVKDPKAALKLLGDQSFDLIITDIEMDGMNGIEFCTKLRAMSNYKNTPVVFVTNLASFEYRAQACLSGGNDLIAKPFLYTELALKSLVLAVKSRLASAQS